MPKSVATVSLTGLHTASNFFPSDEPAAPASLNIIFNELKRILTAHRKGAIVIRGGSNGDIALVSEKKVEVDGRWKNETYFAAALVQKGYVGFYFMPIYGDTALKNEIGTQLLACLKGKSCFHIRRNDPVLYKQISEALDAGYRLYKERGWV
ncbi:DUF1801 domain-containing protein [Deminuibacter soli]|uniref:DUF1801 domain-containing protein n=1 Tax=Deminuibacter soli TaxID=2291815 RepID=A0A3E1NKJ5_9BACT|nr:DUF1801 domain-containing protein [Deminuibacter soli]RFM28446.1 DUF1801 domain-containing protein [Deminuibacter soli]